MVKSYPIVIVEWVDSHRTGGWGENESVMSQTRDYSKLACVSVGFLFRADKKSITIMQSFDNDSCADGVTIPRCSITSMRYIRK